MVPDEDLVNTRYFFLFNSSNKNVSIQGKDIKMKDVKEFMK